ncbi:MAG: hypothetical protein WCT20_04555 [Candidatus Babeliales bacterium]
MKKFQFFYLLFVVAAFELCAAAQQAQADEQPVDNSVASTDVSADDMTLFGAQEEAVVDDVGTTADQNITQVDSAAQVMPGTSLSVMPQDEVADDGFFEEFFDDGEFVAGDATVVDTPIKTTPLVAATSAGVGSSVVGSSKVSKKQSLKEQAKIKKLQQLSDKRLRAKRAGNKKLRRDMKNRKGLQQNGKKMHKRRGRRRKASQDKSVKSRVVPVGQEAKGVTPQK